MLNLSELFDSVTTIGGKFRNHGNRVVVEAPVVTITPAIIASLAENQDWLESMYSAPISTINEPTDVNNDEEMTPEEFFAEMSRM